MTDPFPAGDTDFEEYPIESVEKSQGGEFSIGHGSGLGFNLGKDLPIEPRKGMIVRFYQAATFARKRGVFVDGVKIYYRTAEEDHEFNEVQMYGADAADWLQRWDDGKGVWSIVMGGLGPGYEQCIQITAAEILRHLLAEKYDHAAWKDADTWKRDRDAIEKAAFKNKKIDELGISGAQWGAAVSLATSFYCRGPRAVLHDPAVKDRKIQVSRTFPNG